MTRRTVDETDLDDLFGMSRTRDDAPPEALMARVLADALAAQPRPAAAQARPQAAAAPGGWRGWLAGLGGWPALGGLTAATVAGFWIGVAPPTALGDWAQGLLGLQQTVSLAPEGDLFGLATEG